MRRPVVLAAAFTMIACSTAEDVAQTANMDSQGQQLVTPPAANRRDSINADALPGGLETRVPLPSNTISLTYDDGPTPNTIPIAQMLHDNGIHATFFMRGCNFLNGPTPDPRSTVCFQAPQYMDSIIAQVLALGHRVANHTEDHLHLDALADSGDDASVLYQVRTMQERLNRYITDGLFLFRAPYHDWSASATNAVLGDSTLNHIVGSIGYDIDGGDWSCSCVNPSEQRCAAKGLPRPSDLSLLGQWAAQCCAAYDLPTPSTSLTAVACGQRYRASADLRLGNLRNGIVQLHDWLEFDTQSDYAVQLTAQILAQFPRGSGAGQFTYVPLDAFPGVITAASFKPPAVWSTAFNASGWSSASSYPTIRLTDVNGDGAADICGRSSDGIWCALSNRNGFGAATRWLDSNFTDAMGWGPVQYGSTIQFGDINGDGRADVCGRGGGGIWCALSNGSAMGPARQWSWDFADSGNWASAESYYSSIRLADVNGDGRADVCARGTGGIFCALSNGWSFGPLQWWTGSQFTDALGWLPSAYGATITFGDLNGDGKMDVCGRAISGMVCALSTGTAFGQDSYWTEFDAEFSDKDGWAVPSKYRSIHLADVNGDGKADVCGRNATGVVCSHSNGASFSAYRYMRNDEFTDSVLVGGNLTFRWSPAEYGSTVQLGDIDGDGKADVCGRFAGGIMCAR